MESNAPLSFSEIVKQIKRFIFGIFDISRDSDKSNTIEEIKSSIYMKGASAWVLIFSILIASVGLNTSSTAVVIGAMLISPLMGPILGIGLALGINSIDFLKKALNNFAVMVILSLLTSFLFFSIPIFQNETEELIARTFPDVRDVIIALSGGLSLIIAISQKNKLFNAIAGVAIATALMPPLCTAGYGLATGKWSFFLGALFLFSINTIFIASATFLVVRFLKFPYEEYANSSRRKLLSRVISILALSIFLPSIYMFYQLYKKSDFNQKVDALINDLKTEKGVLILDVRKDYASREIRFAVIGKSLSEKEVDSFKAEMKDLGYENCTFKVFQDAGNIETMTKMKDIENSFVSNQQLLVKKDADLLEKDRQIFELKNQLNAKQTESFAFSQVANEIKALNDQINQVSYSSRIVTNFTKIDTIPTFEIEWLKKTNAKIRKEETEKLETWLQVKLNNKKIVVKEN